MKFNQQDYITQISIKGKNYTVFNLKKLETNGIADMGRLPFSIKIIIENLLRKFDDQTVTGSDIEHIAAWQKTYDVPQEIPFYPSRVLMQDFTGVPAVVDLAAMRDAIKVQGGDPGKINPKIPVDLIVDHSVQLDYYGTADALEKNVEMEYQRNRERYTLLKWAQKSFNNFRVVPPNSGICHQVNLEYLGQVVAEMSDQGRQVAFPDTLIGTDSHTTMINGIGCLGWGVGGIEAEAVMLGEPYYMSIPEVIGVVLEGELRQGVTATDLVLTITERLRKHNVVEKFVEFTGPGVKNLPVTHRATIANMSPEYGATMGYFPVDEKTIEYLNKTGRQKQGELVAAYTRTTGLYNDGRRLPDYSDMIGLDLSQVQPSIAGPARPQDRIPLTQVKKSMSDMLPSDASTATDSPKTGEELTNGSIVIAAITSCTNTSNPYVMVGAGLFAKNAVEKGIRVPAYVKTSLVPGSKVVVDYLTSSGLMPYLETLGFYTAGFGCTTCIGNSGPLAPEFEKQIKEKNLTVAAVLSGNRNFQARIHQQVKANFLMSPILVIAFAIAGKIDIDLYAEPIAYDDENHPVFFKDLWPDAKAVEEIVQEKIYPDLFSQVYGTIFDGDEFWQSLPITDSETFDWDQNSLYIKRPPYFEDFSLTPPAPGDIRNARALLVLGDSVTTDHISPAGAIHPDYPAGRYLRKENVPPEEFNSYGSRRGNHEVMMRGTFGNIRIINKLVSPKEGSYTKKFPGDNEMFVYDAALAYKVDITPLIVIGGKEYGTGSSRDWAAKGTNLLGIKAVLAESFERIHRNNLVGMGVLPLVFKKGENMDTFGLTGTEIFSVKNIENITPGKELTLTAENPDGKKTEFKVIAKLNTNTEVRYFQHGGILQYVLRKLV